MIGKLTFEGVEQDVQTGRNGHFPRTGCGVVEVHDTKRRLQGARGDTSLVRLGGDVEDGRAGSLRTCTLEVSLAPYRWWPSWRPVRQSSRPWSGLWISYHLRPHR